MFEYIANGYSSDDMIMFVNKRQPRHVAVHGFPEEITQGHAFAHDFCHYGKSL